MKTEIKYILRQRDPKAFKGMVKSHLSPERMAEIVFRKNYGRKIDFANPKIFDEKLLTLYCRDYCHNPLVRDCTDKLKVRDYISGQGYAGTLNKLLGVYRNSDEINMNDLPSRFVLKTNHGCGMNIFVYDKEKLDTKIAFSRLDEWLNLDYGRLSGELQYSGIKARIMAEEFINTATGELPIDYKFFCSRGDVICCLIISERTRHVNRLFVDKDYNWMDVDVNPSLKDYKKTKPKSYAAMWDMAAKISEGFPFVRVDLYDVSGRIIFGELTFTPHGMIHDYMKPEAQQWIGARIQI